MDSVNLLRGICNAENKIKSVFLLHNYIYDRVIPEDHSRKLLNKAADFSFVNDLCRDAYTPAFGRPACEPEMMFKIIFLQVLYNVSDRRIEEEVNFNLVLKWFVGLTIDESPLDSSSFTRFRGRLGEERFANIFLSSHILRTIPLERYNFLLKPLNDSKDMEPRWIQEQIPCVSGAISR